MMNLPQTIRDTITHESKTLTDLALKIHANPEIAYEEHKACKWQVTILKKWGWKVTHPVGKLDTAYRAESGKGKPVFAFLAEYDALRDLGHGCGHNLIAPVALGAGKALANLLRDQKIQGKVVILGTPAEESAGGKLKMIKAGALKGIDAAIMAHPASKTGPDLGTNAIRRLHVSFAGKAAHASCSPEKGLNALDGVMLLFQGVNAWRQHLPEASRVHGIVTDGGVAPNIVPESASCTFFLRSSDDAYLDDMVARFEDMVKGAGLMTGCKPHVDHDPMAYKALRANMPLCEAYVAAANRIGFKARMPDGPGRGSSDFGDVSHELPGAHVGFAITRRKTPGHSIAFRKAACSDYALKQMLRAAEALALVGGRFFAEPEFQGQIAEEFRRTVK
jgi:amidohydrolase